MTVQPLTSLDGAVATRYRFDLLDVEENLIGSLDSVSGGHAKWDAYASVKGTGQLDVTDLGRSVDWLNVRIRPHILRSLEGTAYPETDTPAGVFLCAAPVELADKLSILDQDVISLPGQGRPGEPDPVATSYSLPAGTNIVDTIVSIITDVHEFTPAIQPDAVVTAQPMTWEPGTTRLKVINDLLDAGNYYSLWCDGYGQYRVEPYVYPTDRTPLYELDTPFSKGPNSLMAPDWEYDNDIYAIPNRYIVIGQGTQEDPALFATAVNLDDTSPYSYTRRGERWITRVETGVEAVDYAALEAYARRQLSAATSVTTSITLDHLYLPDLLVNSVVRFTNPDAALDIRCAVIQTEIPFDPIALCKSQFRDVGPYITTVQP